MGRLPVPKPGFLDTCEYLGYIYGERRWRGRRGLIFTRDSMHGEIEVFSAQGHHRGALDASPELRSSPPEEGGEFVSDVLRMNPTFFSLYEQGRITEDRLDEFIAAWHESGDEERRSLAEFLGMTDEEYSVSLMAPDSLPLIRRARRKHQPLRELLVPYLYKLRSAADPMDRPVIHALSGWLGQPESGQPGSGQPDSG